VRSFYDSDNDGIGDFNGITEKLDYLQELGITAIWLMPIHPSPSYHGYDVINYYAVNLEYGTLDDFKRLLEEAYKRDIRIIIDLVINHTSSLHPFFVAANSNPNSLYHDWYVWADEIQGTGWHQGNHGFYYGLFWDGMPDLNYNNPQVTKFAHRISDYWLSEIGVDGFRVDAAKHLIEQDGQIENTSATHDWYQEYYVTYKSNHPDAYTVGEVFGAGALIATTYENQFDHIFNFELASGIVNSVNGESNTGINSALTFTLENIDNGDYATFLTNHDQNRVMSVLNGNEEKAKLAAFMLLTLPGTPYLYYGEEIGMQGKKPDEDIRLPMHWSDEENAGFSGSKPWRGPDPNFPQVNVALQENNPDSLLFHYRELIRLRKAYSALRTGQTILLGTGNSGVYAILRSEGDEHLLILANLTKSPIEDYALTLTDEVFQDGTMTLETLFGNDQGTPLTIKNNLFNNYKPLGKLSPCQAYVFQLK
jgi:glycosidase